jgi:N-succinyldiaminopimelate aminotransferase
VLGAAARRGALEHTGGPAGIFLWLRVPGGDDVAAFQRLLERSLLVVPGSYLGSGGEGHLRVSLTPTPEQIAAAAALLAAGVDTDLDATAG